MNAYAIGTNIKKLREENQITQQQLADSLGISYQAVSKWECGTTIPDVVLLPQIAEFFNVTIDDLFKTEITVYRNRAERLMCLYEDDINNIAFEDNLRKRKYIPEWVKRAVLFRDKGCCVFCKRDLTGLYSILEDNEKHFDHIVPLNEGGLNDVCNIQLSCQDCNLAKSDTSKTSTLYQSAY